MLREGDTKKGLLKDGRRKEAKKSLESELDMKGKSEALI